VELCAGVWYCDGRKIGGYVIEVEGLYFDWDTEKNLSISKSMVCRLKKTIPSFGIMPL